MSKSWYNFFVVTDGETTEAPAAGSPDAATTASPRRVTDLVPDAASDLAIVDVPLADPATPLTALEDIYSSARIAAPAHGYTVLKVADMLQSEHIRALPADVKRKSILVALEAAGVSVDDIVQDAVQRDRALDTYERVLERNLDELRAAKQAENAGLEQQIAERVAELRGRINENNQGVGRESASLQAWQARKQEEERRIAEAVSYFVSENPISTTASPAPPADNKGDTNAR
jgi:hypothetical protein